MKTKPIIANRITIGVDVYLGTMEEDLTLKYALVNYGYLLRVTAAVTRYSFEDFANVIEANCSTEEPRTAEVVNTLRTLHARMVAADNTAEPEASSV